MTPIEIAKYVFREEGVNWEWHGSKKKYGNVVQAKQRSMWLIRQICPKMTFREIGKIFSTDSSNVITACKRINNYIETSKCDMQVMSSYYKEITGEEIESTTVSKSGDNYLLAIKSLKNGKIIQEKLEISDKVFKIIVHEYKMICE